MSPMNFLIVEDNDNMRRMIKTIVAELADETHECRDGAEAVALYAAYLPDWVLMDVRMKNLDGIAATRQIKASFPQANIMIVTDYTDAKLRRSAFEAGACEFVGKDNPFDVCRILRGHK